MNEFEKNDVLKKVSSVLQFCQDIVSRLSSLSPPAPAAEMEMNNNNDNFTDITNNFNDQIGELANSNKEVHKEFIETTTTEFGDEEDDEAHEDDLWWDSSSPPPQFYTLVFDDDNVSLYSLDESYADFLLPSDMLEDVKLPSDMLDNVRTPSDVSQDVMMKTNKSRDVMMMSETKLMESVVQFLRIATPNSIYKPAWREELIKEKIVPELFLVWTNAEEIFGDVRPEDNDDDNQYAPPVIQYPSIDLHSVNTRFIENVPKPSLFPVHGVSSDPDFYHKWYDSNEPYKKIQKFRQPYPFGAEYGYETNVGVVLPSTEPIHGYIWCKGEGWRLYAVKPGERDRTFQRSRRRA